MGMRSFSKTASNTSDRRILLLELAPLEGTRKLPEPNRMKVRRKIRYRLTGCGL